MLDVLKDLKYNGGKEGLLFFFCDVLNLRSIKIQDAEIICSHATNTRQLSVKDILSYCNAFGWVHISNEYISVTADIQPFIDDREKLNNVLVESSVEQLFSLQIFTPYMFSYDSVRYCYSFKNELLPLSFASVRNVLISQGFIIPIRDNQETQFIISHSFESLIAKQCKKQIKHLTLDRLKKQIEDNEIAGEKAESFVLSYEKNRIGASLCEKIRRISEIDVTAGYDIISFNSGKSINYDRFIEVKAISKSGFYWSKNEYDIAKLLGQHYYLYLVDLTYCNNKDYHPLMICNPAKDLFSSDNWIIETQNYHIRKIDSDYRSL